LTLRCNNAALTATAARGKPKMAANDGNGKAIPEKERQRKRNGSGRRTRTTQPGRKLNNVNFALSYFQRLMVRLVRPSNPWKNQNCGSQREKLSLTRLKVERRKSA